MHSVSKIIKRALFWTQENLGVKLEPWGEEIHIKEEQIDESEGDN